MARIAGVDLPSTKRVEIALTYIYGIGRPRSRAILQQTRIDFNKPVKALTEQEITALRKEIEAKHQVEGDLRRKIQNDIARLKTIKCYRGVRHTVGLPVRGQKTRSNARSWKGSRPAKAGKRDRGK
ncbi:30S ribosomal protein S13 [Candidatus Acetothermia bacterium]|jgi:small subunit ribosomal protein S13|nr:30S ribosomal protein S13 [Candidatus Acetothermia bacterium]MCI2431159.1 30S ribosomal protein S13 [Candidatus Acetothermia bacterium]MCI2436049.1 30S ribosomal protein S13 [Candidatus Acetothermia bacterium]